MGGAIAPALVVVLHGPLASGNVIVAATRVEIESVEILLSELGVVANLIHWTACGHQIVQQEESLHHHEQIQQFCHPQVFFT